MPQVFLTSEEFGEETFDYDTLKEARDGFNRLKKSCQAETDSLFGPVGHKGKLRPGDEVVPIRTAADRKAVAQTEAMFANAMKSQMAMFVAVGGKLGSGA